MLVRKHTHLIACGYVSQPSHAPLPVEITVEERGYIGTRVIGQLSFPLSSVIRRGLTRGEFRFQTGSGTAKLDLRWTRYL